MSSATFCNKLNSLSNKQQLQSLITTNKRFMYGCVENTGISGGSNNPIVGKNTAINLSSMDLSNTINYGGTLNANLNNSNIDNSKFYGGFIKNSTCIDLNSNNSIFNQISFNQVHGPSGTYSNSVFNFSNFNTSNFNNSTYNNCVFNNHTFNLCSLNNCNFENTSINISKILEINSTESNFTNCKFDNIIITNSNFDNSNFTNSEITNTTITKNDINIKPIIFYSNKIINNTVQDIVVYGTNLTDNSMEELIVSLRDKFRNIIPYYSLSYYSSYLIIKTDISNISGPLFLNLNNESTQIAQVVTDTTPIIKSPTTPITLGQSGGNIHVYGANFSTNDNIFLTINILDENNTKIPLDTNRYNISRNSTNNFIIQLHNLSDLNINSPAQLILEIANQNNQKTSAILANINLVNIVNPIIVNKSINFIQNKLINITGSGFSSSSIIELYSINTDNSEYVPLNISLTDEYEKPIIQINDNILSVAIQSLPDIEDIYGVVYTNGISSNNGKPVQVGKIIPSTRNQVSNLSLNGIAVNRFVNSNFTGAKITNTIFNRNIFIGSNFTNVYFKNVEFIDCNFNNSILTGADLSEVTINNSTFCGAIYDHTTLWPEKFDYKLATRCSPTEYENFISGKTTVWKPYSSQNEDNT